jgi:hypothetical protein
VPPWHEGIRDAVKAYGAETVNKASLEVLRFPGILVTSTFEARMILEYFEGKKDG